MRVTHSLILLCDGVDAALGLARPIRVLHVLEAAGTLHPVLQSQSINQNSSSGFRVQRVQGSGFRVQRVQSKFEFRVQGQESSGFRVQRVQGLGFREFRVQGLGI
jgi:hypothetical protein